MNNESNVMVSIFCCTYNHEKYIRQCLDSFIMQDTKFKYEIIIHDDASTDRTANIIKEYEKKYSDIIIPIYQTENKYSKGIDIWNVYQIPLSKGKYVAICEGDDYWIDKNKLQKQVDCLENNPEYGMCYTRAISYLQNINQMGKKWGRKISSFNEFIRIGNNIPTLTSVVRKDLYLQYVKEVKPEEKNWKMGDFPMWLWFSQKKMYYLDDVTGVYRVLNNSLSHSNSFIKDNEFINSYYDIIIFFCILYNKTKYLKYIDNNRNYSLIKSAIIHNNFEYANKNYTSIKIINWRCAALKILAKYSIVYNYYSIIIKYFK